MSAGCAGGREWTKFNTVAQVGYTAAHVADWAQTRQVAKNPDTYHESNPILGEHPSTRQVDAWFAGTLAGNWLIAYALPHPYREVFQVGSVSCEVYWVVHNDRLGVALKW